MLFNADRPPAQAVSKVPEVTLAFWIVKIAATTLGETGGDSVTMTLLHADKNAHNGGYLIGTAVLFAILAGLVVWQIAARRFYPVLYWATIVASTTFGTTMADLADRSLGIGYTGGSALLFGCLMVVLGFQFRGRQFRTVAEQLADQRALRLDGRTLLYDQHGHQAIRDQKQHREQWQPAVLLRRFGQSFRRKHRQCGGYGGGIERFRQTSPLSSPRARRQTEECISSANSANPCNRLIKLRLALQEWPNCGPPSATGCT